MIPPEKIYVDTEDRLSDSILYGFIKKRKDDDIEYIRKDVFIEKALEWIVEEIRPYYSEVKYKYEDFKNNMKGA